MSSKVIGDYTAAITIDGSTNYLLIQPGSASTAYKKINRNVLLGITGSPIGDTDSQSLTNKTLGNTNTVTLKDTLFTLQDDGDTTKQAKFQLSGITTATTRTYTLPNASSTLADIATAQTFTNKTLTSPTITGGTIANATITVDSIAGYSSATVVTVGGVQMSAGTVATSGAVGTSALAANAITPATLVAGTGSTWAWQTWTPSYTNFTAGNGTLNYSRYIQIGKTVFGRLKFTLGGTSAVSGVPGFSAPVTPNSDYTASPIGIPVGIVNSDSTVAFYPGQVIMDTSGRLNLYFGKTDATYLTSPNTSATIPYVWGINNIIWFTFSYEAA